jgi:hypothetical protein
MSSDITRFLILRWMGGSAGPTAAGPPISPGSHAYA